MNEQELDQWPPDRAAPETLLGQLQRGLGSGARAALAAGPSAAPIVLEAIAVDQRWDRQIDERASYYAGLVVGLQIEADAVDELLRTHAERTPEDERAREPIALQVLGSLGWRGDQNAVDALRREASSGPYWVRAIECLTDGPDAEPLVGWEARTAGLADAVIARGPGAVPTDRWEVDFARVPWKTWAEQHPAIRVQLPDDSEPEDARRAPPDLSGQTTAELLARPGRRMLLPVAAELAGRTSDADVAAMLAAAEDEQLPMRAAAIKALGEQRCTQLLPVLATLSSSTQPPQVYRRMVGALRALPFDLTREVLAQWLVDDPDRSRRRVAATVFGEHAGVQERELARAALARELEEEAYPDQYLICSLAAALGKAPGGPVTELTRAFREMTYSYGRYEVADALAATDPDFGRTLAVDCLWDCTQRIRETGAAYVALDAPGVVGRLRELANDPHEDSRVRASAAARLV